MVSIPVEVEVLARVLGRHPDFRVQRRLGRFERAGLPGLEVGVVTGVALDVETTGFDPAQDRIIELAMQRFTADADGRIVETGPMLAFLEDPGVPITGAITEVTGLRDADVKGRAIHDGEAVGTLLGADFVVSHNAAFDRPFVEARLPEAAGLAWACSLNDVDWSELGFEGRTQSQLICQIGGFYDAHRASVDVNALLHLLDHGISGGATVLSRMLANARRASFRLEAHGAPRSASDALKARGWRWSPGRRCWTIEVDARRRDEEVDWATIRVYGATDAPVVVEVDWRTRHGC